MKYVLCKDTYFIELQKMKYVWAPAQIRPVIYVFNNFLGLPADMKQKALNDFGILEFEDRCPVYRWKWDSALSPMDITFKMDEEMEYFDKFANENTKIVSVQSGNKLVTTTKNSYGTWITTTKFNENFAVMVNIWKSKPIC